MIGVDPQDEVGLHIRDVTQNHIDVLGHLPNLGHALKRPRLRLVPQVEPRFDAGREGLEAVAPQPLEVRFRQE